jgi:hypothetical protein
VEVRCESIGVCALNHFEAGLFLRTIRFGEKHLFFSLVAVKGKYFSYKRLLEASKQRFLGY